MNPLLFGIWSPRILTLFGIRIRLHLTFIIYITVVLLKELLKGSDGQLNNYAIYFCILFGTVLAHEFGHCFMARRLGGYPEEILMTPFGGLALVDAPFYPRTQLWVAVAGPLVNVGFILLLLIGIAPLGIFPVMNFQQFPFIYLPDQGILNDIFTINIFLLLFNLIPAFPLDGEQILRAVLWEKIGLRHATLIAVKVAKVAAVLLGIWGLVTMNTSGIFLIAIAMFIYLTAEQERLMLAERTVYGDNSFGFDFSSEIRGLATSTPPKRTQSTATRLRERFKRRRKQKAAQEKIRLHQEIDLLLEKISKTGMASLTRKERWFLKQASKKIKD